MSDQAAQDQWVKRVLGIEAARADAVAVGALKERLEAGADALRALRKASAPEAAELTAQFAAAVAAVNARSAIAGAAVEALEAGLARATSAVRAREAAPGRLGGIAYSKLLLRWRETQTLCDGNLKALGAALLARPDVQADPRLDQVKKAVAALPTLVPTFGGQLEDVLDAGMKAGQDAEVAQLDAKGIAAIDAYRQQLAAAPLQALEQFAAKDLGNVLPLHSALDQVLVELRQHFSASS